MAVVRIDRHVLGVVAAQMFEIEFSQLDRGIGRIDPVNLELVVVGDVQASRAGVVGQARRLVCEVQEAGRFTWVPSGCSFHRFVVRKNGPSSTSASLTKNPMPGT